jgi:hypothetical protein
MAIKTDPNVNGRQLLDDLYSGDLVVLTRLDAVGDLVEHTQAELSKLFDPYPPEEAHLHITPDEMAKLLGRWKPLFIHSDRSNDLVRRIIREAGFDPGETHYDVPKPRTSFPEGHLTTGIAFAFPWHRDTWYAAPSQQINWWMPIYPVSAMNAMSFDTANFARSVPNDSASFDYYQANSDRLTVASQVGTDRRARPRAIDHQASTDTIVLPNPGSILLFSGANLHTSIPNTTRRARYSIDFRTVDVSDVLSGRGAPMSDVACSGIAIRDFINVDDGRPFEEATVVSLFGAPPPGVMLLFDAAAAEESAVIAR